MATQGLSERRALTVVRMSTSSLRYVPRPDPDPGLRDRIVAWAHRPRRYGAGMIDLKLRQEGRLREAQAGRAEVGGGPRPGYAPGQEGAGGGGAWTRGGRRGGDWGRGALTGARGPPR